MNSQAFQRVTSLVIAIALVTFDAQILFGQRDRDSAPAAQVAPMVPTKKSMRQVTAKKPLPPPVGSTATQLGQTTVKQASATRGATSQRVAIQGTENTKTGNSNSGVPTAKMENIQTANVIDAKTASEPATTKTPMETGSVIKQAGYEETTKGINADGQDPLLLEHRKRFQPQPSAMMTPPMLGNVPAVHGALIGLRPGEAASERLIQYQLAMANLERENQELRQQQAQLQAKIKESHDQLLIAVREIQLARKEVSTARVDLDRLKGDVQSLREKARSSEKEHESLLRSMGPLLQQLLEGNEVSALPPNPPE